MYGMGDGKSVSIVAKGIFFLALGLNYVNHCNLIGHPGSPS